MKGGAFVEQGIQLWQRLNRREQRLVSVGLIVITVAFIYFVLFQPAWQGRDKLRAQLPELREGVAKIESLASEFKTLGEVRSTTKSGPAVRSDLQRLLSAAELDKYATMDAGTDLIRIKFDQAEFESLMGWLFQVVRDVKLRVVDVTISRDTSPGRVAATVALERPTGKANSQ